jgi:hypothetical protein
MAEPLFALHPMSAGDLIDRAARIYRRHFLSILRLAVIPIGIATIVNLYAERLEGLALGFWLAILAGEILTTFAEAALVRWIADPGRQQAASLWQCYRPILRRTGALSGASLLVTPLAIVLVFGPILAVGAAVSIARGAEGAIGWVVTAFLMLVLGGLFLAAWLLVCRWSIAWAAVAIEGVRLGQALRRSWRLVRGNTWRAGAIMLFGLAVSMGPSVPFILSALGGMEDWLLIRIVITHGTALLLGPLSALALALLYFDCRVRKEALDLEVAIAAMERAPGPAATAGPPRGVAPGDTPGDPRPA